MPRNDNASAASVARRPRWRVAKRAAGSICTPASIRNTKAVNDGCDVERNQAPHAAVSTSIIGRERRLIHQSGTNSTAAIISTASVHVTGFRYDRTNTTSSIRSCHVAPSRQ